MIYIGLVIIALSIYLLVKQYESRMVLLAAGIAMAAIAGDPLAAFDAFSKSMVNGALIQAICSVMGFAFVMKLTECDKHLVNLFGNGLRKIRPVLVPAAVMATFAINVALPSAAGAAAAVGAIFIPILISSGVHPATAGAAVLAGTFGSMLNPGLSHNPFVAKLAGVGPMDVIAVHAKADIIGGLIGAFSLAIVDKYLTKDKAYGQGKTVDEMKKISVNLLYAIIPLLPVVLLMLGTVSSLPVLKKVGVPHAMLIGAIIALAVTRTKPQEITKAFFEGMGNAFANIMGIIIAAGVFVGGMTSIGLVKAFIDLLTHATGIVKYAATFGPFLLAVIAGSGDAAAFAFNEAVTPHAQKFGLEVINMGSIAALTGCFGRTMSPIAGATIVCATIAGVSPMELAKRNAPGMIIATIVSMFILL